MCDREKRYKFVTRERGSRKGDGIYLYYAYHNVESGEKAKMEFIHCVQ